MKTCGNAVVVIMIIFKFWNTKKKKFGNTFCETEILHLIHMVEPDVVGEGFRASLYLHCLWIQPPASRSGTWHRWSSAWEQREKRMILEDDV